MLTPPTLSRLAAVHDQERYTQVAHARRITQALATAPGRPDHAKASVLTLVAAASLTVQTVIVSLLIDRRAQAAVAIVLALVAGALLGPDGVEAGLSTSPSRPYL